MENNQEQLDKLTSELKLLREAFDTHIHGQYDKTRLLKESSLGLTDNTVNDVTFDNHGFAPKSPDDSTKFLNGAYTPAYASVKDSDLSTSDITTNNATTSKHGFLKKLSNDATEFMDGTGAWSTPGSYAYGLSARALSDADNTQTIAHGLGVTPKYIRLTLEFSSGTDPMGRGIFLYDGTTKTFVGHAYSNSTWNDMGSGTDFRLYEAAANNEYVDGEVSIDSTNISIEWTKTNAPTGTWNILWEAVA